jgi:hypothetical protein
MRTLKKLIEDNFFVEVHQDGNTLWIPMLEDQNKNICIDKTDKEQYYVSSGIDCCLCDCDETVIYVLLNFIKDKHKWGNFENKN